MAGNRGRYTSWFLMLSDKSFPESGYAALGFVQSARWSCNLTTMQIDTKTPEEVDEEAVSDEQFEEYLNSQIGAGGEDTTSSQSGADSQDLNAVLQQLTELVARQQKEIERLEERVDDLEKRTDEQKRWRKEITEVANRAQSEATEAKDTAEKGKEIARCASGKVATLEKEMEDGSDEPEGGTTTGGAEPSSSPLDFLANCRDTRVKELLVEKHNNKRKYRAIQVAKRWEEFAKVRDGRRGKVVIWLREDVEDALTAVMGEKPHPQIVTRVWDTLQAIGGEDLVEARRKISNKQEAHQILRMNLPDAKSLCENRYHQYDLLEDELRGHAGGVTPVVTAAD